MRYEMKVFQHLSGILANGYLARSKP